MRKTILCLTLLISACAPSEEAMRRQQQFNADLDAIGEDGQIAYLTCLFDDKLWECRQAVWNRKPQPHLPGHEQKEFVRRYLGEAERRGAQALLESEHHPCGTLKDLGKYFWRDGQRAECSNGKEYQILRSGESWRIVPVEPL